jgi:hypothetical protein
MIRVGGSGTAEGLGAMLERQCAYRVAIPTSVKGQLKLFAKFL